MCSQKCTHACTELTALISYTWSDPIIAPSVAAVFSGSIVYNMGVSPLYGNIDTCVNNYCIDIVNEGNC